MVEKHLLVTVGSSGNTSDSLRFVRGFFGNKWALRLTLFYVAPRASAVGASQQGPEAALLAAVEEAKKSEGHTVMQESKRWLKAHGCNMDNVETKIVRSRAGTVQEIIQEATAGLYDAVVIGRRGLSWMSEMVDESVSHRLMWEELDFPLWLCRRTPAKVGRGVLLCLDGSDACYRMADHVGFILAEEPSHAVHMLHVADGKSGSGDVFAKAEQILTGNGVEANRMRRMEGRGDVVDCIVDTAGKLGCGVVAVGRKAGPPTTRERLFPGSVSTRLLRSLERTTLWVSK